MALDLVYGDITVVDITEGATHYHADYVYPVGEKPRLRQLKLKTIYFIGGKNDTKRLCKKI